MRITTMICALAVTLAIHSCYYDNADELFPTPGGGCDTSGVVGYNSDIKPLLQGYCGSENSCHNSGSNSGNPAVKLETYVQVASLDTARLMGSIEHAAGYDPMPKNGGKLSDCRIALVRKWLREGKQP